MPLFKRKPKIDPALTKVEISDVVERIEVTAFPYISRTESAEERARLNLPPGMHCYSLRRYLGVGGKAESEEELFTPVQLREEFKLEVGCSGFYIAEWNLRLPILSTESFRLKLGVATDPPRGQDWCLSPLERGIYCWSPLTVIDMMLLEGKVYNSNRELYSQRLAIIAEQLLSKPVTEQIERHFLGQRNEEGELVKKNEIRRLIEQGYSPTRERYLVALEEQLKSEIPSVFKSEKYTYQIQNGQLVI